MFRINASFTLAPRCSTIVSMTMVGLEADAWTSFVGWLRLSRKTHGRNVTSDRQSAHRLGMGSAASPWGQYQ